MNMRIEEITGQSLREALPPILEGILPPQESAIKGTDLIAKIKEVTGARYEDSTIRYHLSILSQDPTTPIGKVEQGQGYFLRPASLRATGVDETARLREVEAICCEMFAAGSELGKTMGLMDYCVLLKELERRYAKLQPEEPDHV